MFLRLSYAQFHHLLMGCEKALTSQAPVRNKQATPTPVKPEETRGHSLAALTLTLPINYDLSMIPVSMSVFLLHLESSKVLTLPPSRSLSWSSP